MLSTVEVNCKLEGVDMEGGGATSARCEDRSAEVEEAAAALVVEEGGEIEDATGEEVAAEDTSTAVHSRPSFL